MKKKQRALLVLCAALCLLSLSAMTAVLLTGGSPQTVSFTPPPFAPAAQAGVPDVPPGLGYGEVDAKAFKAAMCGVFAPDNSSVDIWLTNPSHNAVWLKLRVLDGSGNILGETGLIKPGEHLQSMALEEVPEPGTGIVFKVMAYEPETYRSAGAVSLNTVVS